MKKNRKIITGSLLLVVLLIGLAFFAGTRNTADWDFIQQVGGIQTRQPIPTENGYLLPIRCDVSGLDFITVKPTLANSALSCLKTKIKVKDKSIHVKVVSGVSYFKRHNSICAPVSIGKLTEGTYTVYYGDNEDARKIIGEFILPSTHQQH